MQGKLDLNLIRERGRAAIAELFGQHYQSSLRVARGILRSDDDAQDAVQKAYLSALKHMDEFRGEASFKTWITRIVINVCFMHIRQSSQGIVTRCDTDLPVALNAPDLTTKSPEDSAWCSELRSALAAALARLPKQYKEVLVLHAMTGLTVHEIALRLGLSLSAAKTRLFRARGRMRRHLGPVWTSPVSSARLSA